MVPSRRWRLRHSAAYGHILALPTARRYEDLLVWSQNQFEQEPAESAENHLRHVPLSVSLRSLRPPVQSCGRSGDGTFGITGGRGKDVTVQTKLRRALPFIPLFAAMLTRKSSHHTARRDTNNTWHEHHCWHEHHVIRSSRHQQTAPITIEPNHQSTRIEHDHHLLTAWIIAAVWLEVAIVWQIISTQDTTEAKHRCRAEAVANGIICDAKHQHERKGTS